MRGKKTLINTMFALLEEVIAIVCGFILPRLILSAWGSKYNGLTTSITQFLSCAVLLRAGIGGVTRAALYKPLAENNKKEINSIIKATDNFMKKIGLILAGIIVFFSVIYPFFVQEDFEWIFSFTLFLIIGISTFAESFFGITYLIVLQADQKLWISSMLKSICYILNTVIAAILIFSGCGIHIVKLGSALVYVLYPVILQVYVRKKYNINTKVEPNKKAIAQRWDAFWHQVASFVMINTDVMVLTLFSNMIEVSVYSVYNLVISGLRRLIQTFSNSLEAAFGNMIAKKEDNILEENLSIIELVIYAISTVVYASAAVLVLQFVSIYTKGITDAEYIRPLFAYILIIAQFFSSVRAPYQIIVQAAGHYKQTKKGAIIEPVLNLFISIALSIRFGLIGIAIGTLVSTLFRTIQYAIYVAKNIIRRSQFKFIFRCVISFVEAITIMIVIKLIGISYAENYTSWILNGIIVVIISSAIVLIGELIFFNKDVRKLKNKIFNIFKKRKKKKE